MKASPFEYARPASLTEAISLLTVQAGTARVLAGGQSLGPMLKICDWRSRVCWYMWIVCRNSRALPLMPIR